MLEKDQKVMVQTSMYSFEGKVVGKANDNITSYIIECTDGFIPNETYQYSTTIIPFNNLKSI